MVSNIISGTARRFTTGTLALFAPTWLIMMASQRIWKTSLMPTMITARRYRQIKSRLLARSVKTLRLCWQRKTAVERTIRRWHHRLRKHRLQRSLSNERLVVFRYWADRSVAQISLLMSVLAGRRCWTVPASLGWPIIPLPQQMSPAISTMPWVRMVMRLLRWTVLCIFMRRMVMANRPMPGRFRLL